MHHRVTAYNTATASTNKIHDDSVAKSLGFRGGLVPGVDVFAYLCHLPAEQWGTAWLEHGTIWARFESPVYDGDDIDVTGAETGSGALELSLVDSSGAASAIGRAALAADTPPPLTVDEWPSGAPPETPPAASAATLTARSFGSIEATFVADRAGEYLDDVRETLPLFREERRAHPGWLLRFANYVLTANVRMGPWIHVESTVRLLGAVHDGERVQTRALVTEVRERSGHRFVDLDVLQLVGDRPVARTAHTAIYQPPRRPGAVTGIDSEATTERVALDATSWVDVTRGWLSGADELFDALLTGVAWQTSQLFRYDHWVEERRLGAGWRPGTPLPHPALAEAHRSLQHRYGARFEGFSMIQYRDGNDGQAFHRDTDMKWLDDTVIAILSLGATRPWLLRPKTSRHDHTQTRGATHDLAPGSGDLLVMGGRCQADWEHSVPYRLGQTVATRISIQWRYTSRRGRPFVGGSYRAPLNYSRRG